MWGHWMFWILIGGLVLFMFRHGGCCGHTGHGSSGNGEKGNDPTHKPT